MIPAPFSWARLFKQKMWRWAVPGRRLPIQEGALPSRICRSALTMFGASSPGFDPVVRTAIALTVGADLVIDFTPKIGAGSKGTTV
jgi:hypothetical protein